MSIGVKVICIYFVRWGLKLLGLNLNHVFFWASLYQFCLLIQAGQMTKLSEHVTWPTTLTLDPHVWSLLLHPSSFPYMLVSVRHYSSVLDLLPFLSFQMILDLNIKYKIFKFEFVKGLHHQKNIAISTSYWFTYKTIYINIKCYLDILRYF